MTVLLAAALAVQVSIRPYITSPTISPSPQDYELRSAEPINWRCKLRSAKGGDLEVSGRFSKMTESKKFGVLATRPVDLRFSRPRGLSGAGAVGWRWTPHQPSDYFFEIGTPSANYKAEMQFIEPGKKGYMTLLSSKGTVSEVGGILTLWQIEALGFCETAVTSKGVAKK